MEHQDPVRRPLAWSSIGDVANRDPRHPFNQRNRSRSPYRDRSRSPFGHYYGHEDRVYEEQTVQEHVPRAETRRDTMTRIIDATTVLE